MERPPDLDASPAAQRALDALGLVLLLATCALLVHRMTSGDCQYMVWSDRDLARSQVDLLALPTAGPELSTGTGSRIPGGAFHLLLWLAGRAAPGPHAPWLAQVGLDGLAALVIGASVRSRLGWLPASVAASAFLSLGPNVVNQQPLWNPAWLSIFVAVATHAWVRVVADRDGRGLVLWAVALALGAQMHVTAALLALVMVPSLIRARPARAIRSWAWAAVGALGVYAPYLWDEAAHGAVNTRLMLAGTTGQGWVGLPYTLSIVTALRALGGERPLDLLHAHAPLWLVEGLASVAIGLLSLGAWSLARDRSPRSAEARRIGVGLGLLSGALLLLVCTTDELDFVRSNNSRYLLVLAGPLAWCAGAATDAVVRAAGRRHVGLSIAVGVALLMSMGERLAAADVFSVEARTTRSCRSTVAWLDDAAAKLGTSRADVTGRTVVLARSGPSGLSREFAMPVDALLHAGGEVFPGSGRPPCAAIVPASSPRPGVRAQTTVAELQRAVGRDTPVDQILDQVSLDGDVELIRYTTPRLRCPTNMSQRYVLSPEERLTRQRSDGVPQDTATRLESSPGTARWLVRLDAADGRFSPPWDVWALITATRTADGLTLSLHSNQLRGHAWNAGFFVDARVVGPTIVARAADGAEVGVLTLADGAVGAEGALTPLSDVAPWPPAMTLALRVDLEPSALGHGDAGPGPLTRREIALPGGAP